jgi:hypothetical protein
MPAGEIRRRVQRQPAETVTAKLQLPYVLRGAEPVFQILIQTADDAKNVQLDVRDVIEQLLEATREQNELLKLIATSLEESRSAGADTARPAEPSGDLVEAAPVPPADKPAENPDA